MLGCTNRPAQFTQLVEHLTAIEGRMRGFRSGSMTPHPVLRTTLSPLTRGMGKEGSSCSKTEHSKRVAAVLAAFQPGVEGIAQAVTEQVDADDRDQDGEAGEGDDPGRGQDEFAAVGEH
jgi:hypothetical protein